MSESQMQRDGNRYVVMKGGEQIASLVVDRYGDRAMLHHQVGRFSPSILCELRGHFEQVRADLRAEGVNLLVASSDCWTEKLGKYWRLMGFRFAGKCKVLEKEVHYAVMEA